MADADNATRAPESDAYETSAPTTSTPESHIVGEHCVTDRPTRRLLSTGFRNSIADHNVASGQASTGEIIKLNDIDVSRAQPPVA